MIITILKLVTLVSSFLRPKTILAVDPTQGLLNCGSSDNAMNCGVPVDPTKDLPLLTQRAIEYVLVIGGFVALCGVVYGAVLFLTAAGDTEKLAKGRKALLASFVGVTIIVMALIAVNIVSELVGGDVVDTPS